MRAVLAVRKAGNGQGRGEKGRKRKGGGNGAKNVQGRNEMRREEGVRGR